MLHHTFSTSSTSFVNTSKCLCNLSSIKVVINKNLSGSSVGSNTSNIFDKNTALYGFKKGGVADEH